MLTAQSGTTNEGTVFTPNDIKNYGDVNNFLKNNWVKLTASQLAEIDHWYPKAEQFPGKGEYWRTAANAYGEMRYTCPGLYLNQAFASHGAPNTWHYQYVPSLPPFLAHLTYPSWSVVSDANSKNGLGATHTAEAASIWGTSGAPDNANTPYIQGYWLSFIRTHDVNKLKYKDAPTWEGWDNDGQKRLRFVNDPTKDAMESVDQTQRDRCTAMVNIGKDIAQ
jgi:carboxylesterase type B